MAKRPELRAFAECLADFSEADTAVALIWFLDHSDGVEEHSARDIANLMHELSLRGNVNVSRLDGYLSRHPDLNRGARPGAFKLKLARRQNLDAALSAFLDHPSVPLKVDDHVLASADFTGTRRYLEKLVLQINGSYQYRFYDGCAVMCRRLIETLLIDVFEKQGQAEAIKANNQYLSFGEVIVVAKKGGLSLARGTPKFLDRIKSVGDTAAHDRHYVTKKDDIDDFKLDFRKVTAELLHLAGIESR